MLITQNAVSSFTSLSCIDMTGSEDSVIDVSFSGEGEACDLMRQWEGWQTRYTCSILYHALFYMVPTDLLQVWLLE